MGQRNILTSQFDAATELVGAGAAITAAGPGQVGGVNRVVNVGTGIVDATLIVDVDLIDISSGDETYELRLQGSTTADFTADVVNLATVRVGKAGTTGASADSVAGRYARRFLNTPTGQVNPNGPPSGGYPYLRMYHVPSGTTPSINYRAFITSDVLSA